MADTTLLDGDLWLPSEFPYEYGSVDSSSSLLTSPLSSTGSETDADADESLNELTRRFSNSSLQKPALQFGSPESTLNPVGSWSVSRKGNPNAPFLFPPSPPIRKDDAWDLIYIASGQVPRLKMTGDVTQRLLPLHPSQFVKTPASGACTHRCFYSTLPQINPIKQVRLIRPQDQIAKQQSVSFGGFSQSPLQPLQMQNCYGHNQPQIYSEFVPKPVFLGGSDYNGVKKSPCTGTGVFLPRKYANPAESRKKTGQMSPLPRARVSQPQNRNTSLMNAHLQPRALPCFNGSFLPQYDNLMGRKNAI